MTNANEDLQADVSQEEIVQSSETEAIETDNETTETEENSKEDVVTLKKSEYTKLKRRAIAYQSLKENSPAPTEKKNSPDINTDELYLVAKGYEDNEIDQLKIIARGSNITLREAVNSDLFKVYQEKLQAEARKAKAKLSASNSSGVSNNQPVMKPGMTTDEHRAAWEKMMSGK